MTDLFSTKDLLTVATVDQAEVGTKGYFGDNLSNLIEKVRQGKVEILTDTIPDVTYCFKSNNDLHFVFFLPLNRVKKQDSTYRPLKTFDELFDFLMPNNDEKDTDRKAELLLGKVYQLKRKSTGNVSYRYFYTINLSENGILINGLDLDYLFDKYEIKKNGKWVPFGIKEE